MFWGQKRLKNASKSRFLGCFGHFGPENAVFFTTFWRFEREGIRGPLPPSTRLRWTGCCARGEYRRTQGPRQRENAWSRSLRGYVRRCPPGRFPTGRTARGFSCAAGRREVAPRTDACALVRGCVFPRLSFSPALPFRGAPFFMRIIGRGRTHPRSLSSFVHWGATARRPFSSLLPPPFHLRQGYGGHNRPPPPIKDPAAH